MSDDLISYQKIPKPTNRQHHHRSESDFKRVQKYQKNKNLTNITTQKIKLLTIMLIYWNGS